MGKSFWLLPAGMVPSEFMILLAKGIQVVAYCSHTIWSLGRCYPWPLQPAHHHRKQQQSSLGDWMVPSNHLTLPHRRCNQSEHTKAAASLMALKQTLATPVPVYLQLATLLIPRVWWLRPAGIDSFASGIFGNKIAAKLPQKRFFRERPFLWMSTNLETEF